MELEAVSSDQLHLNDLFIDPVTNMLYEFRGRRGSSKTSQSFYAKDVIADKISEMQFKGFKTLLRVNGNLPKYQILEFNNNTVSLFNIATGDIFELSSNHIPDINQAKEAYNSGKEVSAEVFEFEDIKMLFKIIYNVVETSEAKKSEEKKEKETIQVEKRVSGHIKEIEKLKSKRRVFTASESVPRKPRVSESTKKPKSVKRTVSPQTKKEFVDKAKKKPIKEIKKKTKVKDKPKPSAKDPINPKLFKGMGPKAFEILTETYGITNLKALITADANELSKIPRVSLEKAEEWQKHAKELLKKN